MGVTDKVCNIRFCWTVCKITTAILLLFALYLYASWFKSQIPYFLPNTSDKIERIMARRDFLKKNDYLNEFDQGDEKYLEKDHSLKKKIADKNFINKKSRPRKFEASFEMDEEGQSENVDVDEILDKQLYPNRNRFAKENKAENVNDVKDGLRQKSVENEFVENRLFPGRQQLSKKFGLDGEDRTDRLLEVGFKENSAENTILDKNIYQNREKIRKKLDMDDKDIREMSTELLDNYKNNVFDGRLSKKKDLLQKVQKIKHNQNNVEKFKAGNFEKSKVWNFEKSRTFYENKDISNITNVLNYHMDLKQRLPQCIIIGMRKAGTSALITFLELNKNIKTARKEVHFFDKDENYYKGFDWYKEQMPYSHADQITIEKTPRYVLEDKVPDRIYRMNSSIKLIFIVKEPVLRAISEYVQNYVRSKKNRKMAFEEYALKRRTGEVNVEYRPINRSVYYQYMPKWLNRFHRKQIHIVDGDKFVVKPEIELNKIENFLGLKQEINSDMFYFNKTKGFKCARRDDFSEPICLGVDKGRDHPDVLSSVIKRLQDFYRPLNKKFFNQIKQEFNWP